MDPITRKNIKKLLFDKVCPPAILEQIQTDRAEGKTLCPKMNNVINIYSQILIDNPAPGVAQ